MSEYEEGYIGQGSACPSDQERMKYTLMQKLREKTKLPLERMLQLAK